MRPLNKTLQKLNQSILATWYAHSFLAYLLYPLSLLFQIIAKIRYNWIVRVKGQAKLPVPVIIVGNITVGGTGKTPLVACLVEKLRQEGFYPGVISRGYRSRQPTDQPILITPQSPVSVGDEPLLLARLARCPVVIGKNRPAAARFLLQNFPQVNIIISDDGLQHYALARDVEIAVMDGARRLGNGFCLPAGPLRENPKRLLSVDFVVCNGQAQPHEWEMKTEFAENLYQITDPNQICALAHFKGKRVHAVAGIGHPERFFSLLRSHGIALVEHIFNDHHDYCAADLLFNEHLPILMTEKDAVKCEAFASKEVWAVPLQVRVPNEFIQQLVWRIKNGSKIARDFGVSDLQATSHIQERK